MSEDYLNNFNDWTFRDTSGFGDYIPNFSEIIMKYGPKTAIVFGYIYRATQMQGYSSESTLDMGKHFHFTRQTMSKFIHQLLKLGLILEYSVNPRPDNIDPRIKFYISSNKKYEKLFGVKLPERYE